MPSRVKDSLPWGGRISKPIIIPATAKHRAQRIYIYGTPTRCYIDKPIRILERKS